jgi:hypothetical protein
LRLGAWGVEPAEPFLLEVRTVEGGMLEVFNGSDPRPAAFGDDDRGTRVAVAHSVGLLLLLLFLLLKVKKAKPDAREEGERGREERRTLTPL